MVSVIEFPPVEIIGYTPNVIQPVSVSRGLISGRYPSQYKPARRAPQVVVNGIGTDLDGAGKVERFKRLLQYGLNLTRFEPLPAHWLAATSGMAGKRGRLPFEWRTGDEVFTWETGGQTFTWRYGQEIIGTGVSTSEGDWINCTGFPPNVQVAFTNELVQVGDQYAYAARPATSNAAGAARIYLDSPLPSGEVVVGVRESAVFELADMPTASQRPGGQVVYTMDLLEVFEAETDGFTEVPWS